MTRRRLVVALPVAVVVAVLAVIVLGSGDKPYRLSVTLENAAGLRDGSPVVAGGVRVGEVRLRLGRDDRLRAVLEIKRRYAPVSRHTRIAITALNLLGTKQVELIGSGGRDPAPDGSTLAASHVSVSTDLDQVLDALDAPTRAGLTVAINEAGAALTGRRADLSAFMRQLPTSLVRARELLQQVVRQGGALRRLVVRSDRAVGAIAHERRALDRSLTTLAGTATTVAAKRRALRRALRQAPRTLRTLQRVLYDLRDTTVPLGPAARDLRRTAPELDRTLRAVDPLRKVADPVLRDAQAVAPALSRLGRRSSPVLRKAVPVAAALHRAADDVQELTKTLSLSSDNILATADNWSRAIQYRDGLSHVFRGEATATAATLTSVMRRLQPTSEPSARHAEKPAAHRPSPSPSPPSAPAAKRPGSRRPGAASLGGLVPKVVDALGIPAIQDLVDPGAKRDQAGSDGLQGLLDYLLGGHR
jgi:phospholipid/cholesterol/gamma-HCH transport system substrate-binding protein